MKIRLNLKHFIGHTLYHKEDLPFPIKDIPDSFATFKKKVERDSAVRPVTPITSHINTPAITDPGEIPTLQQLGLDEPVTDPRDHFHFKGGESAAKERLQQYFLNFDPALNGKNVRNATSGSQRPTWLSFGCISPRQVYWEAVKHEQSTNHSLILELLWRDYFRFMFKKYGNHFFKADGFKEEAPAVSADQQALLEQSCPVIADGLCRLGDQRRRIGPDRQPPVEHAIDSCNADSRGAGQIGNRRAAIGNDGLRRGIDRF